MDEFTQKLLERTKARRDNLARKVKDLEDMRQCRRKRPLREDDVNGDRERNFSGVKLDTAKRRCTNTRERIERFSKVFDDSNAPVKPQRSNENCPPAGGEEKPLVQSLQARKAMLFQQQNRNSEEIERRKDERQQELAVRLDRRKVLKESTGCKTIMEDSTMDTYDQNSTCSSEKEVVAVKEEKQEKNLPTDQMERNIEPEPVETQTKTIDKNVANDGEQSHQTSSMDVDYQRSQLYSKNSSNALQQDETDHGNISSLTSSIENEQRQVSPTDKSEQKNVSLSSYSADRKEHLVTPKDQIREKSPSSRKSSKEKEQLNSRLLNKHDKQNQSTVVTPFDLCMGCLSPATETPKTTQSKEQSSKFPRHPPVPPKRSNQGDRNTPHLSKDAAKSSSETVTTRNSNKSTTPVERRSCNDSNKGSKDVTKSSSEAVTTRNSNKSTTPVERRSCKDSNRGLPPTAQRFRNRLDEKTNRHTMSLSNRASCGIFCGNFMQQRMNTMTCESLKDLPNASIGERSQEEIRILLEEAATQQNIQFQASNALEICHAGSVEEAEAERALLLAATRHHACLQQVQRLKGDANLSMSDSVLHGQSEFRPVNADLDISGIKIPFDKDFLANSHDNMVHSFMVLVRDKELTILGSNLYSTRDDLQSEITFPNEIHMNNVNHKINLLVEIYELKQCISDNANASGNTSGIKLNTPKFKKQNLLPKPSPKTPKKLMNKLTGRTQHKGSTQQPLSTTPKTAGTPQHTTLKKSRFELIAVATIDRTILQKRTCQLQEIVKPSPLASHIKLTVKCDPKSNVTLRGFLNVHDDIGGYNVETWRRRWCKLTPYSIVLWNYPEDEEKNQTPITVIDLRYSITESVHVLPREECFRRNTFRLDLQFLRPVANSGQVKVQYLLSADGKDERIEWLNAVNQLLTDLHAWQLQISPSNQRQRGCINV